MNESNRLETPVLRHHRFGGGYRREDVEAALASLLVTIRTVERQLDELRQRSEELDEELRAAERELTAYRSREARLEATVLRAEQLVERAGGSTGD